MTTALIIGGGIAGPISAMAMQKAGIDSIVYEAYPTGADDVGAFMTVMNNGLDALRAVGAEQPVLDQSFPANAVEFFSGTGKRLGEVPIRGGSAGAHGPHTITRAGLYRVLHDEMQRRGIPIEHGKRLASATTTSDRVVATFADGSRAEGDLLIGADGIHSTTRSLIDPEAPKPRYTGATTLCGYATDAPVDPRAGVYRMIYGKRVFFAYTTAPDGRTWWFVNIPGPELDKQQLSDTSPGEWKKRALDLVARDKTPASAIIEATDTEITGSNGYDITSTPRWHASRMLLLGDAAHVAAPNAGHGASMAIEDGVVLGQCLRDCTTVEAAFATYEQARRARVEQVVATSARMGSTAIPSLTKRIIRDLVLPRKFKKGPRNTASWLTGHHIDWDTAMSPAVD
jgi:FAD-dependent urate hydroxylase